MNDEDDRLNPEEEQQLELILQTYRWLESEKNRLCDLVALGRSPDKNAARLFEIRDRTHQLVTDAQRHIDHLQES